MRWKLLTRLVSNGKYIQNIITATKIILHD